MKKKNIIYIGIGILLVLGAIFGGLFSTISITPVNMVQYTGQPSWYNNEVTEPITFSSSAMIDDYKFTTETSDYRSEPIYSSLHCLTEQEIKAKYTYPITLTPTVIADGCQIYEATIKEYYCGIYTSAYNYQSQGTPYGDGTQCLYNSCGRTNLRGATMSGCLYNTGDYCSACLAPASTRDKTVTEGGKERLLLGTDVGQGCWAKHTIYYKGAKVWESDWKRNVQFTPRIGKMVVDENGNEIWDAEYEDASQGTWELRDSSDRQSFVRGQYILADFSVSSYYAYATCKSVQNQYQWQIPKNALNVTVNIPETVNVGDTIRAEVVVVNNWKPVSANLISDFTVPTILNMPSTEHKEEIKQIPTGTSKYYFEIKGDKKFDELTMKVQIDMLYAGNKFSGVNGFCYRGDRSKRASDLSRCDYVQIAQVLDGEYRLTQNERTTEVERIVETTRIVEVPVDRVVITDTPTTDSTSTQSRMTFIDYLFYAFIIFVVIGIVLYLMRHKRK